MHFLLLYLFWVLVPNLTIGQYVRDFVENENKQQADANEWPEDDYKQQAEVNEWPEDVFKHQDSADEKAEEKQKHHALFKRDLADDPGFDGEVVKSAQDYPKTKSERKGKNGAKSNKTPPKTGNAANFDMMKPSMHTIVACITVMLAVFHIVICLSVWQQCKIHRNPATVQTIAVDQQPIHPPRRPRNGEQSFSALVEEPPLIGQVPMPPEYKEGETSKPPSYHVILNNSSSRGDEITTNEEPI